MKYKNYYKILELKSDRVSDDEIKNAYRRLAKKYHPDMNPDDAIASERFKDVNEAYQVLGDENSKRKYDRIHNIYRVKDTFEDTKEKLNKDGFSEMANLIFGKKVSNINVNNVKNKSVITKGDNLESQIDISLEEAFFGVEKKLAFKSVEGKTKNISLKIPKGIKNGEKIRIARQGKPSINGGENGDLFIRVNLMNNSKFTLKGFLVIFQLML